MKQIIFMKLIKNKIRWFNGFNINLIILLDNMIKNN